MIRYPVKEVCPKGPENRFFPNVAVLDKIETLKSSISVKCGRKKVSMAGRRWELEKSGLRRPLLEWLSESPHVAWNLSEGKEPDLQRCRRSMATQTEEWNWERNVARISLANSKNGRKPHGQSSISQGKGDTTGMDCVGISDLIYN